MRRCNIVVEQFLQKIWWQDVHMSHSSLGNLNKLTRLGAWDNSLTGSLPESLGEMPTLTYISFASNSLTGQIPAGLGKARNLAEIHLHSNSLSGSIPPALGLLDNLQILSIQDNSLTGSIPEMGQCKKLTHIDLSSNVLTGSIPSSGTIDVVVKNGAYWDYEGCFLSPSPTSASTLVFAYGLETCYAACPADTQSVAISATTCHCYANAVTGQTNDPSLCTEMCTGCTLCSQMCTLCPQMCTMCSGCSPMCDFSPSFIDW